MFSLMSSSRAAELRFAALIWFTLTYDGVDGRRRKLLAKAAAAATVGGGAFCYFGAALGSCGVPGQGWLRRALRQAPNEWWVRGSVAPGWERVEAAFPDRYIWFEPSSRHVTIRSLRSAS